MTAMAYYDLTEEEIEHFLQVVKEKNTTTILDTNINKQYSQKNELWIIVAIVRKFRNIAFTLKKKMQCLCVYHFLVYPLCLLQQQIDRK